VTEGPAHSLVGDSARENKPPKTENQHRSNQINTIIANHDRDHWPVITGMLVQMLLLAAYIIDATGGGAYIIDATGGGVPKGRAGRELGREDSKQ
jgi:hypothetical protein